MNLSHVTPLILTRNEEPNLRRCLERLRWATRVVVLDSLSVDGTRKIAAEFANVSWHERPFDDHTAQWNAGLDLLETDWVLSLDADYVVAEDFAEELRALNPADDVNACFAKFRYLIFGKPLCAAIYPPRAVLFRRQRCRYVTDGHTQLLQISGRSGRLAALIAHDDRKPLAVWLAAQACYAELEAGHLLATPVSALNRADRIRRWVVPAPVLVFCYTLLVRGLFLDGWAGWYYAFQRTLAELTLSLALLHRRLEGSAAPPNVTRTDESARH